MGTDSHTTMINGLGVVGWGVGGIEAEAVMLGQPISMVLPEVVGFRLTGKMAAGVTATDLVLTITEKLRQKGVVDKFVEFYGPSLQELSLADRATISNMGPEYGATVGFFPVDSRTIEYLRQTNRDEQTVKRIEAYLRANEMFIDHSAPTADAVYTSTMELDLSTVSQQHTHTSHSSNTTRCCLLPAASPLQLRARQPAAAPHGERVIPPPLHPCRGLAHLYRPGADTGHGLPAVHGWEDALGGGDADDAVCAVCESGESTESNLIILCEGPCELAYHQECIGAEDVPEGDWFCSDRCA